MSMQTWLDQNIGGRYGNFIDGEWQHVGANAIAIRNAARKDQVLGHFAESTPEEVERAVSAAHHASKTWREVPRP